MRTRTRWLVLLSVVAVLMRVVVAFYLGNVAAAPELMVDQVSYNTLAERLLSGHGFSFPRYWYPFTALDTPTAHWSFLQPIYLAAVYAVFGVQPLAARLVTAVLGGVLLAWMVYRLARRLFAKREDVAILAAAGAAFYAFFILYAATLMTETFYIVALLWSMERALAFVEKPTWKGAFWLGLSLGVAALFRQSVLPWVVVLFCWLWWVGWRQGQARLVFKRLVVAGLVLLACIAPFTVRNYAVYHTFLLLNSNTGYAMYSAQHPDHGTSFREFWAAPLPDDLEPGLNEAQLDRELMRRGIQFVLDDPWRYVRLSWSRVSDYYEFWPTGDTTLLHNAGRVLSIGLYGPFMLYGLLLALRQAWRGATGWRDLMRSPVGLVLLFAIIYPLMHILTWAMPRYRLPVDAVLMPFVAVALLDLWNRWMPATVRQRLAGWLRMDSAT